MVRHCVAGQKFEQGTGVQRCRIHRIHFDVLTGNAVVGVNRLLHTPFRCGAADIAARGTGDARGIAAVGLAHCARAVSSASICSATAVNSAIALADRLAATMASRTAPGSADISAPRRPSCVRDAPCSQSESLPGRSSTRQNSRRANCRRNRSQSSLAYRQHQATDRCRGLCGGDRPGECTAYFWIDDDAWERVLHNRFASMAAFKNIARDGMELAGPILDKPQECSPRITPSTGWPALLTPVPNPPNRNGATRESSRD